MTLDKNKGDRLHEAAKKKVKARTIIKSSWGDSSGAQDPRKVGRTASCHGALCSCPMCGNPRRHYKRKTLAEKKAELPDGGL